MFLELVSKPPRLNLVLDSEHVEENLIECFITNSNHFHKIVPTILLSQLEQHENM